MRRIRVTFVGYETFWMTVAVDGLMARYAQELDCRWQVWPSTFAERIRFVRMLLSSDLVVRLGMPFEFQSETNRFFLWMLRVVPALQGANYWIGEDLRIFLDRRERNELTNRDLEAVRQLHHFAVTEHIRDCLTSVGIPAVNAELMGPEREIPEHMPALPSEFRVLSYWMDSRLDSCGAFDVIAAARAMPDTAFDIIGTDGGNLHDVPDNVTFHGRVEDVLAHIERAVVYVRMVEFDALPSSLVEEALLMGRQVVYTFEWPNTTSVPFHDVAALIRVLRDMKTRHARGALPLNAAGREFTIEDSDADRQAALMRDAIVDAVSRPLTR